MKEKIKILIIFGTRPEAIKMAPVIKKLQENSENFEPIVCVTAQHREMLDQVLSIFDLKPDIDLNIMTENQTLDSLTAKALVSITNVIKDKKPNVVLVQGDTTTAMAGALAGFYQKVPVGHVEAGLRTGNIYNPFPEEANRRLISALASYHFAPTKRAVDSLLNEGISKEKVFYTGNTVVDALQMIIRMKNRKDFDFLNINGHKLILVTAHRRENFGKPLENICEALKIVSKRHRDVNIVYPVHLNPNVKEVAYRILSSVDRVSLIPPVEYSELVQLLDRSYIVLTDSGGIQEEAPALGKPVLVTRTETERPEGVEAGVAKLVGTDTKRIVEEVELLLNNKDEYSKMSKATSPYGDGKAAEKIVNILRSI